jgi:precorrin-2 dehydrogenase/sirohydrochlorin ferrochelatase
MGHGYPILLDVSQQQILIVGGGHVAARKTLGLVEAGATRITVVADRFLVEFPPGVRLLNQAYDVSLLEGVRLVFAATNDPKVNDRVVSDARERKIWVNRSDFDDQNPGDFSTPAKYTDQNVVLTVSAASAALAASIRDAIQRRWDPRWTQMAKAMKELRPWIRNHPSIPQQQRAVIFRTLAGDEAMDILSNQGIEALRDWLIQKHPELNNNA